MAQIYGNRWRLRESLGTGGQGDVFLVEDTKGEVTEAALKRVRNPKRRERFRNEVRACTTLSHPSIIKLLDHSDLDSETDKMFLVMPVAHGRSLETRVALYSGLLDATLEVALQLTRGLRYAHEKGVIHRDVKPANILFPSATEHGCWLSDFGICLLRDVERHTEADEPVGPVQFMAPELEGGGQLEVTSAADVYSLGKVIYFMLSGGRVLPRERLREKVYDIFAGAPYRTVLLGGLLDRMICDVSSRLKTMSEVETELLRIQNAERSLGLLSTPTLDLIREVVTDAQLNKSNEEHNEELALRRVENIKRAGTVAQQWIDALAEEFRTTLSVPGVLDIECREVDPARAITVHRDVKGHTTDEYLETVAGVALAVTRHGMEPHVLEFRVGFVSRPRVMVYSPGSVPRAKEEPIVLGFVACYAGRGSDSFGFFTSTSDLENQTKQARSRRGITQALRRVHRRFLGEKFTVSAFGLASDWPSLSGVFRERFSEGLHVFFEYLKDHPGTIYE